MVQRPEGSPVAGTELSASGFIEPVLAGLGIEVVEFGPGEPALRIAVWVGAAPALHGRHQQLRPRRAAVVGGGVNPLVVASLQEQGGFGQLGLAEADLFGRELAYPVAGVGVALVPGVA
jgi:hypothetical protein